MSAPLPTRVSRASARNPVVLPPAGRPPLRLRTPHRACARGRQAPPGLGMAGTTAYPAVRLLGGLAALPHERSQSAEIHVGCAGQWRPPLGRTERDTDRLGYAT